METRLHFALVLAGTQQEPKETKDSERGNEKSFLWAISISCFIKVVGKIRCCEKG